MTAPDKESDSRLILAALYCACAFFLLTLKTYPLNDDWAYGWAVENWIRTGSLRLSNWGSPTLLFQVWWGRLFCLPFGFSFDALRGSTLALGLAGLLAFHQTLLRLGASPRASLAGTLTLLFNPLFFVLSHSFMTDVPALSLMLLSGWAFVEGLERKKDGWLVLGSAFSAAGYLVKQTGPSLALAAAFWKPRRLWAILGLPFCAIAGHALWQRAAGSTFAFQTYLVSGTWAHLSHPATFLGDSLSRLAGASLYLGLFLFPWAAVGRTARRGSWIAVTALAAVWLAVLLLHLVLTTGNTVGRFGLGTCTLAACSAKASGLFGRPLFWTILTSAAPIVLALLFWRLDFGRKLWKSPLGAYVLGFFLAFALSLAGRDYYDRYYLALFPPLIALAVINIEIRWRFFAPALALLAAWSLLGTWDYLAWNEARWAAGERLHALGIPYESIENGIDWNAYHSYESKMAGLMRTRPLADIRWDEWLEGSRFQGYVSFSSEPKGRNPVGTQTYWCPLTLRRENVYLWRAR